MATITPFIRTSKKKTEEVNVRFRLVDGRKKQLFYSSKITVNPNHWDEKRHEIKAKTVLSDTLKIKFKKEVSELSNLILQIYEGIVDKDIFTSSQLDIEINKHTNPEKHRYEEADNTFFKVFDEFLQKHNVSAIRKADYKILKKMLERFELFQQCDVNKKYKITFDNFSSDALFRFDYFIKNEHSIYKDYPTIYSSMRERYPIKGLKKESHIPSQRGQNTRNSIYSKLRAFIRWSIKHGKATKNPFDKFTIPPEVYGTPYYITIEERNMLYNKDLSENKEVAIQRDIFIFQCLIGCRIGDLLKMKKTDVIDGAIQYVAHKTKEKAPTTIRVPLNSIAKEILDRYKNTNGDALLPFTSAQKYNSAIKTAFEAANLTRNVTVLNPKTGVEEKISLTKVASSHLARRCFIGNLYKQVKDPNLIGKLSGHSENSRAFARYRDIDEDMKISLVKLLE